MDVKPQLVKFFIKEEAKKKPCFIDQIYSWKIKKDGWYGYIEVRQGEVIPVIRTRTGKEIVTLARQTRDHKGLWENLFKDALVLNGRFIFEIRDYYDKAKNVYEMNSILKKEKVQQRCWFFVHDLLDYDVPDETYKQRESKLRLTAFNNQFSSVNASVLMPLLETSDIEQVMRLYRQVVGLGEEGLVGIRCNSKYSWGERNGDLLKLKAEVIVSNCKVMGRIPGEGNGSLLVKLPSGVEQPVAGIDNDKDKRWTKEYLKGKYVDVVCMQVTPSGRLREPRLWECAI